MNDFFAAWLAPVHPAFSKEVADSRWAGVEALVGQADLGLTLKLVSLAVGTGTDKDAERAVSAVIQAGDSSFPMINASFEVRVMSACALAELFSRVESLGDAAALGVRIHAAVYGQPQHAPELPSLAAAFLERRSLEARKASAFSVTPWTAKEQKAIVGSLEGVEETDPIALSNAVKASILTLFPAMLRAFTAQGQALRAVESRQTALDEANDILWWVMTDHVAHDGVPRGTLGCWELAARSGFEFAGLVRYPVPPFAASDFLRTVISRGDSGGRSPQLRSVLTKIPDTLRVERRHAFEGVPAEYRALLPIHELIAGGTGGRFAMEPLALAATCAHEQLLISALSEV